MQGQVDNTCGKKIGPNRLPCFEVPRHKVVAQAMSIEK
jgi:hypothetical protein